MLYFSKKFVTQRSCGECILRNSISLAISISFTNSIFGPLILWKNYKLSLLYHIFQNGTNFMIIYLPQILQDYISRINDKLINWKQNQFLTNKHFVRQHVCQNNVLIPLKIYSLLLRQTIFDTQRPIPHLRIWVHVKPRQLLCPPS